MELFGYFIPSEVFWAIGALFVFAGVVDFLITNGIVSDKKPGR